MCYGYCCEGGEGGGGNFVCADAAGNGLTCTGNRLNVDWTTAPGGLKGDPGEPGEPGADGKSAYQEWLDARNTGNEQDFLNSLKGADGADGAPGTVAGVTGDDIINPTLNPDGSLTLAADCAAIKTCVTTGSTETALDADGNLALSPPEVGVVTLAS